MPFNIREIVVSTLFVSHTLSSQSGTNMDAPEQMGLYFNGNGALKQEGREFIHDNEDQQKPIRGNH